MKLFRFIKRIAVDAIQSEFVKSTIGLVVFVATYFLIAYIIGKFCELLGWQTPPSDAFGKGALCILTLFIMVWFAAFCAWLYDKAKDVIFYLKDTWNSL